MKKSKIITFIGGFYIFGGIIALLSLIFNGIYIPIGYLYIKRVNFSSWIILGLAVLTFCISADLTVKLNTQPYIGNLLYSLFVIIATIVKRNEFINNFTNLSIQKISEK